MKKLIFLALIILPLTSWGHSDRDYIYQYENVTVRFRTGSLFEEIQNAKIIGQYAALLCKKRSYDKPVFLDFIHDYGHYYRGKNHSFITIGSGSYDWISFYQPEYDSIMDQTVYQSIPLSDTINNSKNIEREITEMKPVKAGEKIIVRQFGFHFTIDLILRVITLVSSVSKSL